MIEYRQNENLSFEEYHDFLRRSDLGGQYPGERFEERIRKLLETRSIAITARNNDEKLIGIAFGVTDFTYFLFITDLGVDREYTRDWGRIIEAYSRDCWWGRWYYSSYHCT